jgi:hypothetical protein
MSNSPYQPPSSSSSPPPYSPHPGPQNTAPTLAAPVEQAFAPLPLRQRGVVETLDVAVKVFKQYWKPLLGWGALANLANTFLSYFGMFLAPPMMIGPSCCVLAAAVRGQRINFNQCWQFTQPRLGNMIAMHVLSGIVAILLLGTLGGLLVWGNVVVIDSLSGTNGSEWVMGLVIILFSVAMWSLAASAVMAWQSLVGIVSCMEEENKGTRSMKRAWTLLQGRWKPAMGLLMALGLAFLALWGILMGLFGMVIGLGGIGQAFSGGSGSELALFGFLGYFFVTTWLLSTLYMPVHYVAMSLFYLDSRVRHEALDLEWSAHRTVETSAAPSFSGGGAPAVPAPNTYFAPVEAPNTQQQNAPQASTYAPPLTPQAPPQVPQAPPLISSAPLLNPHAPPVADDPAFSLFGTTEAAPPSSPPPAPSSSAPLFSAPQPTASAPVSPQFGTPSVEVFAPAPAAPPEVPSPPPFSVPASVPVAPASSSPFAAPPAEASEGAVVFSSPAGAPAPNQTGATPGADASASDPEPYSPFGAPKTR